jgi:23S rRNA (cytosine1962-C5)-methyltransferase
MTEKKVILKPGRERSLGRRHPWIFSGAIASCPQFENGEILPVFSSLNQFLAMAYFHSTNSLAGRVLTFEDEPILECLRKKITQAYSLRKELAKVQKSNAYRLINAEGDGLPGLIVDSYDGHCVMQISTCGMERLRETLVSLIIELVCPKSIYEKSTSRAREQEGLLSLSQVLYGNPINEVAIEENGIAFNVAIIEGQKTGFFLDQRARRKQICDLAKGKRVLNCFAYSGGFSLAALEGGALHVTSVDICKKACELNRKNTLLNDFDMASHRIVAQDALAFLEHEELNYDIIILDPPAFAKRQKEVKNACAGYKRLNQVVFKKSTGQTLLLTCSCSHVISESLFRDLLSQAASESLRDVRILSSHVEAQDHPTSLHHPEGSYLKSLLLFLNSR